MPTALIASEIVSILFLSIIFFSMLHSRKKTRTSSFFILCVGVVIFCNLVDALSYVLEATSCSPSVLWAVNLLSICGADLELIPFAYYIWALISEKEDLSPRFAHFCTGICIIDLLIVFLTAFTGSLFHVENGVFVPGPYFDYLGVLDFLVIICLFVLAFTKRKTAGIKPAVMIGLYFFILVITALLTLTAVQVSYVYVSVSFIIMLIYVSLQEGEIEKGYLQKDLMYELSHKDDLTKLQNRRAYEAALKEMAEVPSAGVIFCDVNGLKITNDRFGHSAGDTLLLRFTELLSKNFAPSELFRISGDEFVVLLRDTDEMELLSAVSRLKRDVYAHGEIASVGCACGPGAEILSLTGIAENNMYNEKKDYYTRLDIPERK